MTIGRYDPDHPPPADAWLELDEQQRTDLVSRYHETVGDLAGNPTLHALMHTVVENQLAGGHQPAVRAMARLLRDGLDRHEAIHALASVLASQIYDALKGAAASSDPKQDVDRALDALTAERWLASAGGNTGKDDASPIHHWDPIETVRRSGPKIGRNDPCPCGSGRKYKRCCGAAGADEPTLH